MISFGLTDRKRKCDKFRTYRPQGIRGTKIRKRSKETDGPATIRHVSLGAVRDVIPWGNGKKMPLVSGRIPGDS